MGGAGLPEDTGVSKSIRHARKIGQQIGLHFAHDLSAMDLDRHHADANIACYVDAGGDDVPPGHDRLGAGSTS